MPFLVREPLNPFTRNLEKTNVVVAVRIGGDEQVFAVGRKGRCAIGVLIGMRREESGFAADYVSYKDI